MSAFMKDGGLAFPRPDWNGSWHGPDSFPGMTLRDWFAGQALQALLAVAVKPDEEASPEMKVGFDYLDGTNCTDVADEAYTVADAMIAAMIAARKGDAL